MRRQARQRREYIYKKSVEDQERTIYERKKRLKNALQGKFRSPRVRRAYVLMLSDDHCHTTKFHPYWFTTLLLLHVEGKPIPTELRSDEAELRKAIEFDDEAHESMSGPDY